jgi:hypothetical protein
MIYNEKRVFLVVNASSLWLNNFSCLFLSFPQITRGVNCSLIKQSVLASMACCLLPALRWVGAVLVGYLWHWRKICKILQSIVSKGRYLKKFPKPC